MKKILIIGAGFLQSFIIKKAKEMGYHTITVDKNPNSIGFRYADEYNTVDIVDQDACLNYALSKKVDGVITAATDYGVLTTSYVAQQMNLPGLDYEVAKTIKNKYMVRRLLHENNVDDLAQYYEVSNIGILDKICSTLNFPLMVKPCDGSGSKAAKRVDSPQDLKEACEDAINSSLIGKALIEDFIDGEEYGVESFVYNGEVHVLGVLGKYMTNPPRYAELGHCMPSQLSIEDRVKVVVTKAVKSLGINYGAVNMDVIITKDNRICIVDVGARMGGNLIGSHIIPFSTEIDYMEILISAAVRDSFNLKLRNLNSRNVVASRLLALAPGKVVSLPDFKKISKEYKVDIYHFLEKGIEIKEYHNNLDGCGYVVAVSDSIQKAVRQAEEAKKVIDEGIIRE